jgi:hypothetical protein
MNLSRADAEQFAAFWVQHCEQQSLAQLKRGFDRAYVGLPRCGAIRRAFSQFECLRDFRTPCSD